MLRGWREFTQFLWNLLYDKMVYRELVINMDEKQRKKFESVLEANCDEFVKDTQKKKYTISCVAICCGGKKEHEKLNNWKQSEGFFCSQLVAAAYVKCGILEYDSGTGSFLPGAFGHHKNLKLTKNFSLGPEVIIEFST